MTDYTARDIHQLDQAYPDAVADIDDFIGNPVHKRRLAEVGPEVFAAEQTRDLAYSIDNPMSLAGWAAIATVRLMEAGKAWEDDTEMAYEQRDAARAMADELRAELAEARAALTEANRKRTVAEAAHEALARDNQAYATQVEQMRAVVDAAKYEYGEMWCLDGECDHETESDEAPCPFIETRYATAAEILAVQALTMSTDGDAIDDDAEIPVSEIRRVLGEAREQVAS